MEKSTRFVVLMLLTGTAFCVRIPNLGDESVWFDEVHSLTLAEGGSFLRIWKALENDAHGPLYFWSLGHWRDYLGASVEIARLWSVFWAAGMVPATFFLARSLKVGERGSILAASLAAFTPSTLYYAQQIRMYTQFATLTALFLALTVRWINRTDETNDHKFLADCGLKTCWMLLGVALIYTHNFAVFVWATVVLWTWTLDRFRPNRRPSTDILVGLVVLLSLALPQLLRVNNRFRDGQGLQWLTESEERGVFLSTLDISEALIVGPYLQPVQPFIRTFAVSVLLALILWRITSRTILHQGRGKSRQAVWLRRIAPFLLLCAMISMPCVVSIYRPILDGGNRYLIYVAPLVCTILGEALSGTKRFLRIPILLLLSSVWFSYYLDFYSNRQQFPWNNATEALLNRVDAKTDRLIIDPSYESLTVLWIAGQDSSHDGQGRTILETAIRNGNAVRAWRLIATPAPGSPSDAKVPGFDFPKVMETWEADHGAKSLQLSLYASLTAR